MAFVRNVDGIEKKPLALLWARAARVILRLDTYSYVSCCGFGREHLLDLMIAYSAVFPRPSRYGKGQASMETSASCEARSAPSLYPPAGAKRHFRLSQHKSGEG